MRVTASDLFRIAQEWQKAYREANGKDAPAVIWAKGWFKIGGKRFRRAKLEQMRDVLQQIAALSTAHREGE